MRHAPAWLLCGWVLWSEAAAFAPDRATEKAWSIVDATETKKECEALLAKELASPVYQPPQYTNTVVGRRVVSRRTSSDKEFITQEFRCLPAGTDPRPRP